MRQSKKGHDDNLVVLADEEGVESEYRILFDRLFAGHKQYVVLMPVDHENEYEPEVVILRVDEDEDGNSILVTIDDDDEWEGVLKAFEEMDIDDELEDYTILIEDDEDPDEN